MDECRTNYIPQLSDKENVLLTTPYTEEEVKKGLSSKWSTTRPQKEIDLLGCVMVCKIRGLSEHIFKEVLFHLLSKPSEDHKKVLIMSVSVTPNVSLVFSELPASTGNESDDWKMIS
jgi:hypothetical protein